MVLSTVNAEPVGTITSIFEVSSADGLSCALYAMINSACSERSSILEVGGETYYAIEEPTSLNTLELLPELLKAGVRAIKIEGRQRSPAYVAQVTKVWRAAIDRAVADSGFRVQPSWMAELAKVSEGQSHTLGAYHRPWK